MMILQPHIFFAEGNATQRERWTFCMPSFSFGKNPAFSANITSGFASNFRALPSSHPHVWYVHSENAINFTHIFLQLWPRNCSNASSLLWALKQTQYCFLRVGFWCRFTWTAIWPRQLPRLFFRPILDKYLVVCRNLETQGLSYCLIFWVST